MDAEDLLNGAASGNPSESRSASKSPRRPGDRGNDRASHNRTKRNESLESVSGSSMPASRSSLNREEICVGPKTRRFGESSSLQDNSTARQGIETVIGNGVRNSNASRGGCRRRNSSSHLNGVQRLNGVDNPNGVHARGIQFNMAAAIQNGKGSGYFGSAKDFPPLVGSSTSLPSTHNGHLGRGANCNNALPPFDYRNQSGAPIHSNGSCQNQTQFRCHNSNHFVRATGSIESARVRRRMEENYSNDFCRASFRDANNDGYTSTDSSHSDNCRAVKQHSKKNSKAQRGRRVDGRQPRVQRSSQCPCNVVNNQPQNISPAFVPTTFNNHSSSVLPPHIARLHNSQVLSPIPQFTVPPPVLPKPCSASGQNSSCVNVYASDMSNTTNSVMRGTSSFYSNTSRSVHGYAPTHESYLSSDYPNSHKTGSIIPVDNGRTSTSCKTPLVTQVSRSNNVNESVPTTASSNPESADRYSENVLKDENENIPKTPLQRQLQQEMARAEATRLPLFKEKGLDARACTFEPRQMVPDSEGNLFVMTRELKGNCVFGPKLYTRSDGKYIISIPDVEGNSQESESLQDTRVTPTKRRSKHETSAQNAHHPVLPTLHEYPEQYTTDSQFDQIPHTPNVADSNVMAFIGYPPTHYQTETTPAVNPPAMVSQTPNHIDKGSNNMLYPQYFTSYQTCTVDDGQIQSVPQAVPQKVPQEYPQNAQQFQNVPQDPSTIQNHQISYQTVQNHFQNPQNTNHVPQNSYQIPNTQHSRPDMAQQTHQNMQPTISPHGAFFGQVVSNSPYLNPQTIVSNPTPHPPNPLPATNIPPPVYPAYNLIPAMIPNSHVPLTPTSAPPTPRSAHPVTPNSVPPQPPPQGQHIFVYGGPMIPAIPNANPPVMNLQACLATVETDNPNPMAAIEPSTFSQNDPTDKSEINEKSEMDKLARQICEKFIKLSRRCSTLGKSKTDAELTDELLRNEHIRKLYQTSFAATNHNIVNVNEKSKDKSLDSKEEESDKSEKSDSSDDYSNTK